LFSYFCNIFVSDNDVYVNVPLFNQLNFFTMKKVKIFIAGIMLIGMVGVGIAGEMASSSDIVIHEILLIDSEQGTDELITVEEDLAGLTIHNSSVEIPGDLESEEPNSSGGTNRVCIDSENVCHKCENCRVISRIPGN